MKIIESENLFLNDRKILSKYFDTDKANIIKLIKPIEKDNNLFEYLYETLNENKLICFYQCLNNTEINLIVKDSLGNQNKCYLEILNISTQLAADLKKINYLYLQAGEKINKL